MLATPLAADTSASVAGTSLSLQAAYRDAAAIWESGLLWQDLSPDSSCIFEQPRP